MGINRGIEYFFGYHIKFGSWGRASKVTGLVFLSIWSKIVFWMDAILQAYSKRVKVKHLKKLKLAATYKWYVTSPPAPVQL